MRSQKEQCLQHAGVDRETPLAVLKPSSFGITWRLLKTSPWLLVLPSSFFMFFRSRWIDVVIDVYIFLVVLGRMSIMIDALLVRSFALYMDRVGKQYAFVEKVVYLNDVKMRMLIGRNCYFINSSLRVIHDKGNFFIAG